LPSAAAEPLPFGQIVPGRADIETSLVEAKKAFGKIDILVNNAGVYDWSPIEEITEEQFHKHFDVNVLPGLLLATQEAVKQFDSTGGNIINISSTVTSIGHREFVGLHRHKKARSGRHHQNAGPKELGRANSASTPSNPGLVKRKACVQPASTKATFARALKAETPLGRIGQPEDIALPRFPRVVHSAWITGETAASGGWPSLNRINTYEFIKASHKEIQIMKLNCIGSRFLRRGLDRASARW